MGIEQLHHLIKMANQIAVNFAYEEDQAAAAQAVANHLQRFWSPPMRAQLLDMLRSDDDTLHPLVKRALQQLV